MVSGPIEGGGPLGEPAAGGEEAPEFAKQAQLELELPTGKGELDEEQMRRLLTCKRLSEGACQRLQLAALGRKNSLHVGVDELPPLTEGETMRHQSVSYGARELAADCLAGSAGSLQRALAGQRPQSVFGSQKRNSQELQSEATTSCSSSTSLDGGSRSPSRRRSSTVSQCSSVLSEGTRQQLNFDLSPDLAPDSSLLEANQLSPTPAERPCSPEPGSASLSGDEAFERPRAPMSPDSTLGDSADLADLAQAAHSPVESLRRQISSAVRLAGARSAEPPPALEQAEWAARASSAASRRTHSRCSSGSSSASDASNRQSPTGRRRPAPAKRNKS